MNWYKIIKISHFRPYGSSEFLRKLRKLNVQFIRNAVGSHQIWGIPGTNFMSSIPVGSNTHKIKAGTVRKILKELGISVADFENNDITTEPVPVNEVNNNEIAEWQKQPWYQKNLQEQYAKKIIDKYKIAQQNNEQDITNDIWIQGSVVVDGEGNPLKVYHGTRANFNQFDLDYCAMGIIWFSSNKDTILSGESGACGTSIIKEAYLSIKNPASWAEYDKYGIGELKGLGYDGIILDDNYVVFDPSQIKVIK